MPSQFHNLIFGKILLFNMSYLMQLPYVEVNCVVSEIIKISFILDTIKFMDIYCRLSKFHDQLPVQV
jgi:hypothetical protein